MKREYLNYLIIQVQFPQASGIIFDVDSNVTRPVITDENKIFVKINVQGEYQM